jgi:MFS family permease
MRGCQPLTRAVNSVRLKSSFIYLANAVSDLRGNWSVMAVVLAPLVLAAALCLLPETISLERQLAANSTPGSQNISYTQRVSYAPVDEAETPSKKPPLQEPQPYPDWVLNVINILVIPFIGSLVTLVTLCSLKRIQARLREPSIVGEVIAVYQGATTIVLGFIWITVLQLALPELTSLLFEISRGYELNAFIYFGLLLLIILSGLVYAWLYFAEYALVFDDKHSFHALLFSRDLMRKRFFKAATRIVVFIAFLWGYTSLAGVGFWVVSRLLGPVGAMTGFLTATFFLLNVCAISVSFACVAFVVAASSRLYQDLRGPQSVERVESAAQSAMQPTAQLPRAAL